MPRVSCDDVPNGFRETRGAATMDLAELKQEAAPKGRLRVALNFGNVVLAQRGSDPANPGGVSVALAQALAARLGLDHEFVLFDRAGDVSASATKDGWDICFLAIDPLRAKDITFSSPYVAIEGCYVVQDSTAARKVGDVDALRLRIGTVKGSAYTLYLEREAKGAELVAFETATEAEAALKAGKLDGLAGVRQAMVRVVRENPALRQIDEPFMVILQAMGVPTGRERVAEYVAAFVDEMKANGFVARALTESGHGDVRVP